MVLQDKHDHDKCYGCYACYNACPQNCISMEKDDEGFVYPVIDQAACTKCGRCDRACTIGKSSRDIRHVFVQKPDCYYCFASDEAVRKRSISGGMAYTLSAQVVREGGAVFGVSGSWLGKVAHAKAETPDELVPFCGSKNIQSDVNTTFRQAKELLESGRLVMFTGVPCQIAGLHQFLGKEYDNLLTCDLLCKGVPSQDVLKAYVKILEGQRGKTVVSFGRDGTHQFYPVQYIAKYDDGTEEILMHADSPYRKGFLSNLFQRKSCGTCAFAAMPRIGDITLGDMFYLKPEEFARVDPKNIGISMVLANTPAGQKWLQKIQGDIFSAPYPLELAQSKCPNLSVSAQGNPLRNRFFRVYKRRGFEKTYGIIEISHYYGKAKRMLKRYLGKLKKGKA